jgi:predicted amidohydrolase
MSTLRVSLVQMNITDGDPARNLARAEELIGGHPGAQLYLLPELWTTGYTHDAWPALAKETTPGVLEALTVAAHRHSTIIGGTLISLDDHARLVNRFWLVGEGGVLGCYDKAHLFAPMGEPRHLAPGTQRQCVRLDGWTAALSICYDLRFPEMYRLDAVAGATLFLVPSEWPAERGEAMRALAVARALENQAYVALTNRTGVAADGTRFGGGSLIVGPGGEVVAELAEGPGVVTAVLESSRIADVRGPSAHYTGRRSGVDY